jgi:hypothetical protein
MSGGLSFVLDPRVFPNAFRFVSLCLRFFWKQKKLRNDWRVDPGQFKIYVGDSSADTPLTGDFTVSQ